MAMRAKTAGESKAPELVMKLVKVTITGTRPLLMHNGDLADPMNKFAKAIKALTGSGAKGNASDDKEIQKGRFEFEGGMWLGLNGLPCVPGEAIDAMLKGAAKLQRMGKPFERAVACVEDEAPLRYEGMEKVKSVADLLKMYDADPNSIALRRRAKMPSTGASVMRVRPRFKGWKISFTLQVMTGLDVDLGHVRAALDMAGTMIGLGDWHGRYGKFEVTEFKEAK